MELVDNKKSVQGDSISPQKLHSQSELEDYQLARDREKRVIRMPKRCGIVDLISYSFMSTEAVSGNKPQSYREAVNYKEKN